MATGSILQEEASASTVVEQVGGTGEASVSVENEILRQKVIHLIKKARAAVSKAAVAMRKAEAELRHEERRKRQGGAHEALGGR